MSTTILVSDTWTRGDVEEERKRRGGEVEGDDFTPYTS